jgi:hypothetical protein
MSQGIRVQSGVWSGVRIATLPSSAEEGVGAWLLKE